jgi:hypothetical protein
MAFGIILYDVARRIVAIDDAAAVLFDKPAGELVHRQITDFMPQPDRDLQAEARATFERMGEASGQYALEREDGSRMSIIYRVIANAPLAGINLMAITSTALEVGSDSARIRRIDGDVHAGLDVNEDERWFGSAPVRAQDSKRGALLDPPGNVIAAVFPTEEDAWAALLAAQPIGGQPLRIALSSFDGGWPRDLRSVLAASGVDSRFDAIAAIVAEFGGTLMAGAAAQP